MTFDQLSIQTDILKALAEQDYTKPTPIQEQAIPVALEGRDILGIAQTGTGKTAAFAVPVLQRLEKNAPQKRASRRPIRTLVLTPTRELALQIQESFKLYGRHTDLRSCVVFGGVSQRPQETELKKGVDILVATPGRLKDLMQQGLIDLGGIEILILDEADRMLDMGFIHDVRQILTKVPRKRQTLFFSATMPREIAELSRSMLIDPVRISITPEKPTVEKIEQSVYAVNKRNKRHLLSHLLEDESLSSVLVFTRTKHGADRVARDLIRKGVKAQAIHGNKSQNARQTALKNFKRKKTRVLVATDIAARGIDIDDLSHVINFDLPEVPESYVHRIGRTGRAGHAGTALSFCDVAEQKLLRDIERFCHKSLTKVTEHPFPLQEELETPPSNSRSRGTWQKDNRSNRRPSSSRRRR